MFQVLLRIPSGFLRWELLFPIHQPCAALRASSISYRGCESERSDPARRNTTSPPLSLSPFLDRLSKLPELPSPNLAFHWGTCARWTENFDFRRLSCAHRTNHAVATGTSILRLKCVRLNACRTYFSVFFQPPRSLVLGLSHVL